MVDKSCEEIITVCHANACTGCMACLEKCHHNAITIVDSVASYNAFIDSSKCIKCNLCKNVCPANQINFLKPPVEWHQGWADFNRQQSASGGIASEIMRYFIASGGYVASCLYENGSFCFKLTNDLSDISRFCGSKYVKSNPQGIYSDIKSHISRGLKVLFIGLPCQVAAVKKYLNSDQNLYTIDLICHGTPSPIVLFKFLEESKFKLSEIEDISFRKNMDFSLSINGQRIKRKRICDLYTHAFLDGLFYTDNCYECKFAQLKRCSDITIGDSWGTDLSSEIKRGVSLILIQSEKGKELLSNCNIKVFPVDKEKALNNNEQLIRPSSQNKKREKFLKLYHSNSHIKKNLKTLYPRIVAKNNIKTILLFLKIIRD